VIGDPLDPTRNFGPTATEAHYERVLHSIEQAKANQDGELLTGGGAVDREVFGPVMAAMRFSEEAATAAVKLANDSQYQWWSYFFPLKKQ
jgi:acyl-CoA reductase-like NAD-dependent aldehyde dehydrogenase